jgi:hypothetical protein
MEKQQDVAAAGVPGTVPSNPATPVKKPSGVVRRVGPYQIGRTIGEGSFGK